MSVSGSSQAASFNTEVTTGLESYYGSGTFGATLSAPALSATAGGTKQNVNFTYSSGWSGTLTTTYEYVKHANASFDGSSDVNTLSINFGDVFLNDTAKTSFSIFNLLDGAGMTAGLDLDNVVGTGDTTRLFTDLAQFNNLAAGGHLDFLAILDTSLLGISSATYTLYLSDQDIGVGGTTSSLALNLSGRIINRPTAPANVSSIEDVPEPLTLALLGAGLVGLGYARRRGTNRLTGRRGLKILM